jgi:hypothetical protein
MSTLLCESGSISDIFECMANGATTVTTQDKISKNIHNTFDLNRTGDGWYDITIISDSIDYIELVVIGQCGDIVKICDLPYTINDGVVNVTCFTKNDPLYTCYAFLHNCAIRVSHGDTMIATRCIYDNKGRKNLLDKKYIEQMFSNGILRYSIVMLA